jgi:hypothetical protein
LHIGNCRPTAYPDGALRVSTRFHRDDRQRLHISDDLPLRDVREGMRE